MRRFLVSTFALVLLAACASSQIDRKQKAASKMRDTATNIRNTRVQIDRTLNALDGVLSTQPEQLPKA